MPRATPTNRDLQAARESEALAYIESLLLRLEAVGERAKVSEETWRADRYARDKLVYEANEAGISQELIGRLTGLGPQPAVARARRKHLERCAAKGVEP